MTNATATRPRRSRAAASAAPMDASHAPPITLTFDELVDGIRAVFYPRVPAHDDLSQERIIRAARRVLEATGR